MGSRDRLQCALCAQPRTKASAATQTCGKRRRRGDSRLERSERLCRGGRLRPSPLPSESEGVRVTGSVTGNAWVVATAFTARFTRNRGRRRPRLHKRVGEGADVGTAASAVRAEPHRSANPVTPPRGPDKPADPPSGSLGAPYPPSASSATRGAIPR